MSGAGLGAFIDGAIRGYALRRGWDQQDEDREMAREDRDRNIARQADQDGWSREQRDYVREDRNWTSDRRDRTHVLEGRDDKRYEYEQGLYEESDAAAQAGRVIDVPGAVRPAQTSGGAGSDSVAGGQGRDGLTNAPDSLIRTESGGDFRAQNNAVGAGGQRGHFGRSQFGHARLQDAMRAGAIPQGTTPEQFMASPSLQKQAEDWHFSDINTQIDRLNLDRFIGKDVNGDGVLETRDGIIAMAHLGGTEGMRRFLTSGGEYDPADVNGTSLSDYARTHAGETSTESAPPQRGRPTAPGQARAPLDTAGNYELDGDFSMPERIAGAVREAAGPAQTAPRRIASSPRPIPVIRMDLPRAPRVDVPRGAVRPIQTQIAGAQQAGVARAAPQYRRS